MSIFSFSFWTLDNKVKDVRKLFYLLGISFAPQIQIEDLSMEIYEDVCEAFLSPYNTLSQF